MIQLPTFFIFQKIVYKNPLRRVIYPQKSSEIQF